MTRILLQFYKTEFHYRGDTPGFYHELNLEALPKVNEKFHYTEWMFSLMDENEQKRFTNQFLFQPGEYFVIDKLDYSRKETNIEHCFYLIEEFDNGKTGFIEHSDIPK